MPKEGRLKNRPKNSTNEIQQPLKGDNGTICTRDFDCKFSGCIINSKIKQDTWHFKMVITFAFQNIKIF